MLIFHQRPLNFLAAAKGHVGQASASAVLGISTFQPFPLYLHLVRQAAVTVHLSARPHDFSSLAFDIWRLNNPHGFISLNKSLGHGYLGKIWTSQTRFCDLTL